MLPKSHHFSSLLASQNDPQNQKKSDLLPPEIIDFHVFSLCSFFKYSCFTTARASFLRFLELAKFANNYVFLRFSKELFLKGPELTFFDFGRFWEPPKSTRIFKSERLAAARARFSKNHVFY